ncbi:hypothetical protein [Pseudomonas neustonica]|uniref:hypothetical protein n=1 Tax=Pseudomonas neustonica TaxID=2487346 RepID=UPI0013158927|nr:hypothetical protein [Pseudomonas neustonica]|tara:strand:- start:1581 stop:2024 length:444 start_codon:yes stop_codon:yes gene_type:complete
MFLSTQVRECAQLQLFSNRRIYINFCFSKPAWYCTQGITVISIWHCCDGEGTMVLAHSEYVGAPFPEGEQERQLRVDELCLTSHGQDSVFDKLVELTAECLDAPIALISILDNQRQWFLARVGLGATETPRNQSFCAYAVLHAIAGC